MRKLFKDYLAEIPKEEILSYYIEQNHSAKESEKHFNCSQAIFMRLLKHYGIHKPVDLHNEQIKRSKLERFGDPNYNNKEKRAKTNLEKYGVVNQFQRKDLFPLIKKTKIERYGDYANTAKGFTTRITHYGSIEESYRQQAETYKQTCLERYGVPNSAQAEETKSKIAEGLKNTFLEKYGSESYWAMPGAKKSNGAVNSHANTAFAEKLDEAGIPYDREIPLDGKVFDFRVGSTLIEIDPAPTHNVNWSPYGQVRITKNYHEEKTRIAANNGYGCIHVFDWDSPDKIIAMLTARGAVGARKCDCRRISAQEAKNFLDEHHLQGYAKDSCRLGLYYDGKLVSIMTFGKPRYSKRSEWELIRYASCLNVTGGAKKLLSEFIRLYDPESIVSYCDLSKFSGKTYIDLGFKRGRKAGPSCHWYNIKTKQHITDNLLRQRGFDQLFGTSYGKGTSNEQLMLDAGFCQVYDCGQATYIWRKS